jgi:hypothetical protein
LAGGGLVVHAGLWLGVVAHFAFESGRERAKIAISEDAEGYSEAEKGT